MDATEHPTVISLQARRLKKVAKQARKAAVDGSHPKKRDSGSSEARLGINTAVSLAQASELALRNILASLERQLAVTPPRPSPSNVCTAPSGRTLLDANVFEIPSMGVCAPMTRAGNPERSRLLLAKAIETLQQALKDVSNLQGKLVHSLTLVRQEVQNRAERNVAPLTPEAASDLSMFVSAQIRHLGKTALEAQGEPPTD